MTLSRNLRSLRQVKGLSLSALARECGVDKPRLSRIESGHDNVTLKTLYAIAEALDVPPGVLLNPELQPHKEL